MKLFFQIILFLVTVPLLSQNVTVFDVQTGNPVSNVSVFNKEETISLATDENGKVDISKFKFNEVILFSHVSFATVGKNKSNLVKTKSVYLSKNTEELDEVVLHLFKDNAKIKRVPEQTAIIPITKITELAPQTSADLLANISGVKVQKSQSGGGSPVMRGMESNRVLLVVDGVRMNNAIYRKGHLQNSITVGPNLLERTEVVFGPSSVIYGSDALGGVIHYYTKTPKISNENIIKGNFFSRYASANNEITNSISTELQFKKWASLTSVSYADFADLNMGKNRKHGFDNWGKVPFYSDNLNGTYSEFPVENSNQNLQKNTRYTQTDVLQKFYIPFSKNTDFKLNFQYSTSSNVSRFDKLTELKNNQLKFAEWYYGPQNRLLISPQLEIRPNKKWIDKATLTLAYQNIKENRVQRKFGSLNRSYRNEKVDVFSFNGDFSVKTSQNSNLGYGFEVAYNDVMSVAYGKKLNIADNRVIGFSEDFKVQSRYPDGGGTYLSSALYLDYRQDLSKKSILNSGVRVTNTNLTATWKDQTFIQLPDTDINLNNTAITATLGYVYRPIKNWQLSTVISSGFRSPNLDDIGKVREKNGEITVPNINLKPEYAYSAELGIQKFFNEKKFRLSTNIYYTLLTDYIYREKFNLSGKSTAFYDGEEGQIVANINKGNAYITGGTIGFGGKIYKAIETTGSVTYTKGKSFDIKEPLSSIPPLFGDFQINYSKLKWKVGTNLRFNARKKIGDYNFSEGIDNVQSTPIINPDAITDAGKFYGTPSWYTIGCFAKYNLTENVFLQTRLDNIFDIHYKEFASGISASGRSLSISLHAKF